MTTTKTLTESEETLTAAIARLTAVYEIGDEVIIRRPTVHRDTTMARMFAARFHPRTAVLIPGVAVLIPNLL